MAVAPEIIIARSWVPDDLERQLREWSPKSMLGEYVKNVIAKQLPADMMAELIELMSRTVIMESSLELTKVWGPHGPYPSMVEDYGIVGRKVVTTAAVVEICTRFAGTSAANIANFNYHGLGTGVGAEAVGNTTLGTELTTEYTGNVRATGTQSTPGSTNIYQTVATNTLDSGTPAVTEHGVFSASSSGTLLDRTVFSAVNLVGANGDSLQSTYQLTVSAGG